MKKVIPFLIFIITFSSCDHTKGAREDFLKIANSFWSSAVTNKCNEIESMVRFPALMDGMSIDSTEKLNCRCNAIYTTAKFQHKITGILPENLSLKVHEYGWLKPEVFNNHPLLKVHTSGDSSFFLLEVTLQNSEQPATFIFHRDYDKKYGSWKIVMFEDYSLTKLLEKE